MLAFAICRLLPLQHKFYQGSLFVFSSLTLDVGKKMPNAWILQVQVHKWPQGIPRGKIFFNN